MPIAVEVIEVLQVSPKVLSAPQKLWGISSGSDMTLKEFVLDPWKNIVTVFTL